MILHWKKNIKRSNLYANAPWCKLKFVNFFTKKQPLNLRHVYLYYKHTVNELIMIVFIAELSPNQQRVESLAHERAYNPETPL